MKTDFLGREYEAGDIIVYAAMSGRSVTMVKAEVVEIKESGSVKVQPLESSRWQQHSGRHRTIDKRTGKGIDPYSGNGKHIKELSKMRHAVTGEEISGEEFQRRREWGYRGADRIDNQEYFNWKYVPTVFHDYVERIVDPVKPVTLTVTENIVLLEKKVS